MKFFLHLFFACSLLFFFACKEKRKQSVPSTMAADTANYFPILSFIEEQSRYVDLRNLKIIRTITNKNTTKKDTITKAIFTTELSAFKSIAMEFMQQKKQYKETVFQDLGTESYTLNYLNTNSNLPLQRIDILLRAETNTVKQLFARRVYQKSDTSITQQFSFSTDKRMEISTEFSTSNSKPTREIRLIEWTKE